MRHPSNRAPLLRWLLAAALAVPAAAPAQPDGRNAPQSPAGRAAQTQLDASAADLRRALLEPGSALPALPDLEAELQRLTDPAEKKALADSYAALKARETVLREVQGSDSLETLEANVRKAGALFKLPAGEIDALLNRYGAEFERRQAEAKRESGEMAKELQKAIGKLPPHLAKTFDAPMAELQSAIDSGDWGSARSKLDGLFDRLQRSGDAETAAGLADAKAAFHAQFDKAARAFAPVTSPHLAGRDWRLDKAAVPLPGGKAPQPGEAGPGLAGMRQAFLMAASRVSTLFEAQAKRDLFRSERSRQTDQLGADAFVALRRLGHGPAAEEYLALASIADPAERQRATRDFLAKADRLLDAERAKRIPADATPEEREKALEGAFRKHPELGAYLVRRARYQTFVAGAVADRSVAVGTELGLWEVGAAAPEGTKLAYAARQAPQGRFAGLEFTLPDGSTRFEGTADGFRKLIQSRDARTGGATSTLAELRGGVLHRAETHGWDKEGRLILKESVSDGGAVSVSETIDPATGKTVREVRTDPAGRRLISDLRTGERMTIEKDGRVERLAPADEKAWKSQAGRLDANGNFVVETVALSDGRSLKVHGPQVTQLLDKFGRSEGIEVKVDAVGASNARPDRQKAAWEIARQVAAAMRKDDKDSKASFPLANFLAENIQAGARVTVDKDGKVYVVHEMGGQRRVQTAEFRPATALNGNSYGESLVVTEASYFQDGQGEMKLARQAEYLSNGDKLWWRKDFTIKPGGVFTAEKDVTNVSLVYMKRLPAGHYQAGASELKDTVVQEVAGTSAMAAVGQGFMDAPVLGHGLKGLGFVGKTLYSGTVGGGQAIVGGISGSTTYEVEAWASLEKAWSWTSDRPTDIARTLRPEAVQWIDTQVRNHRHEQLEAHLRKQGVTPKTADYDRLLGELVNNDSKRPISNDERLAVLKLKHGAGTYGAQLTEMAQHEQGLTKALLYTAGGGMYIAESTAESLPLVLVTAGLGRVAAIPTAANTGVALRTTVSAAHYTNLAMATSLTGTWIVGGLDNAGQLYSAIEQGDAKKITASASHMLTDAFFAAAAAKGVRDSMRQRAAQQDAAARLGTSPEKLAALEKDLRAKVADAPEGTVLMTVEAAKLDAVLKSSPERTGRLAELASAPEGATVRLGQENFKVTPELKRAAAQLQAAEGKAAGPKAEIIEIDLTGKGGEALKSPAEFLKLLEGLPEGRSKAMALEYQRAYMEAYVDSLTGIRNRKFIDHNIKELVQEPHHRLIGDIDHFKSFNTRFGHEMGDKVLREVAKIWAEEHARAGTSKDFGARMGGEEFFGHVSGNSLDAAVKVAQRINERIQTEVHKNVGLQDPVTMSIGIAQAAPIKKGVSPSEAFRDGYKRADQALYDAKDTGRNKVVFEAGQGEFKTVYDSGKTQPLIVGKGNVELAKPNVKPEFAPEAPKVEVKVAPAQPAKPAAPAGPAGKIEMITGEAKGPLEIALDGKPASLQATFMGKTAKGEAVAVKTPFYKSAETTMTPQEGRVKLLEEMNFLREAGKLKADGKLPQGFEIAEPLGMGQMDRALSRQIYGKDMAEVPTLLMKRADGVTMQRYLSMVEKGQARMTPAELAIFEKGVRALNKSGITHNDLNLGNIMVHRGPDGKIKFTLIDFGAAKAQAKSGNRWSDYIENDVGGLKEIRGYFEDAWRAAGESAPKKPEAVLDLDAPAAAAEAAKAPPKAPAGQRPAQFSVAEESLAQYLRRKDGATVEPLPANAEFRTADASVNGVRTEFKTLDKGAKNETLKNAVIGSARGGGQARDIVVDARGSGLTLAEASRGLYRIAGQRRERFDTVRVVMDGHDFKVDFNRPLEGQIPKP